MARKNQYVLYLDDLKKFVNNFILKADITKAEKDDRLNTVYALIDDCVPFTQYDNAMRITPMGEFMYMLNREANKARMDRMAEYNRKKSLSSSRMVKRTTVAKKKRY